MQCHAMQRIFDLAACRMYNIHALHAAIACSTIVNCAIMQKASTMHMHLNLSLPSTKFAKFNWTVLNIVPVVARFFENI